jgi:hypothetical protein
MSARELSEAEFLKIEAEKSKAAAMAALQKAKAALGHSVDPRGATRRHPLIAIGTAAAVGFVATVVAIPSREERELRHLERLGRAMHPRPETNPAADSKSSGTGSPPSGPTIWMTILREAISFLKPILLAQISSNIRAEEVPREAEAAPPEADPAPATANGNA